MTVEYTTSFEDYKAAQTLYLRARRWPGFRFKLLMYGLPALSVLFIAGAIWNICKHNARSGGVFSGLAAYAVILTVVVVVLRPMNLRRLYRKRRKIAGVEKLDTVFFGFDEEFIRSGYPGRSEGQFRWDAVVEYAEDHKIFLIFISKKMFIYVPKRAMADDQWQSLRDYFRAHGKGIAC
jgi:hypothetical protein